MEGIFNQNSTSPNPSSKNNASLISASVKSSALIDSSNQSNSIPFIKNDSNCNFIDKILGNISCFDTVHNYQSSALIIPGLYLFDSPKDKAIRLHSSLNKTENLQKCLESIPTKQLEQLKSVSRIVFHKSAKPIDLKDVNDMVQIGDDLKKEQIDENEKYIDKTIKKISSIDGVSLEPNKNASRDIVLKKESINLNRLNELIDPLIQMNIDAIAKSESCINQKPTEKSFENNLEKVENLINPTARKMLAHKELDKEQIHSMICLTNASTKDKNDNQTKPVENKINHEKFVNSNELINSQSNMNFGFKLKQVHKQQVNVLKNDESSNKHVKSCSVDKKGEEIFQHNNRQLQDYYEKFSKTYQNLLIDPTQSMNSTQHEKSPSVRKSFDNRLNNTILLNEKRRLSFNENYLLGNFSNMSFQECGKTKELATSKSKQEAIPRENSSDQQSKNFVGSYQNKYEKSVKMMQTNSLALKKDNSVKISSVVSNSNLPPQKVMHPSEKKTPQKIQPKDHDRGKVIVIPIPYACNNKQPLCLTNSMEVSQTIEQAPKWTKSAQITPLLDFSNGVVKQTKKCENYKTSPNEEEFLLKNKLVEVLRKEVLENKIELLKERIEQLNASCSNQAEMNRHPSNQNNRLIRSSTPLTKSNTTAYFPITEHTFPYRTKSNKCTSPGNSLIGLEPSGNSLKIYIKEKSQTNNIAMTNNIQTKQNQIILNESKRRNTVLLPTTTSTSINPSAFRKYDIKKVSTEEVKTKCSKQSQESHGSFDSSIEKSNSNMTIKSILKKTTQNVNSEVGAKIMTNQKNKIDKLSLAYSLMDKLISTSNRIANSSIQRQ
jgi:hypothetical protein